DRRFARAARPRADSNDRRRSLAPGDEPRQLAARCGALGRAGVGRLAAPGGWRRRHRLTHIRRGGVWIGALATGVRASVRYPAVTLPRQAAVDAPSSRPATSRR